MNYGDRTDISFATEHRMFEQEGDKVLGAFQYIEVVIITLQTKPNHGVDSNRYSEACCVLMHAYY